MFSPDFLCENCVKKFVRNKYYDYMMEETCLEKCYNKVICCYCLDFVFQEEALEIFLLDKQLKRELTTCRKHYFDLLVVNTDIKTCISQLKDMISQLDQSFIKIAEIGKILTECEFKYDMLFQTICMKRAQSQEEHINFNIAQNASYRRSAIWKMYCSSCFKPFDENSLMNILICGHSICDVCFPKPSCTLCQQDQNCENKLRENIKIYVTVLLQKFENKNIEFDKHIKDLGKESIVIIDGINCIAKTWGLCLKDKPIYIKEIRRNIVLWKCKLKTIEITVCKTKSPGKSHNTLLYYDLKWEHAFSWMPGYLHETFHLVKNGHKIYVMGKVKGHMKFGEFSSDGNHLFFHAMILDIPQEEAYFVKLNHLKMCAGNLHLSFITLNCNKDNLRLRLIVRLTDPPSSYWFEHYTGETGNSYINAPYERGTLLNNYFESILYFPSENTVKESEVFDLKEILIPEFNEIEDIPLPSYEKGDLFLIELHNGSFSVCRSLLDKLKLKSFGKVFSEDKCSQIDFEDPSVLKVVDCGLQILHF